MTSAYVWWVVSVLLMVAGGAMVVADIRRRRLRAVGRARELQAAREARLAAESASLFDPPHPDPS